MPKVHEVKRAAKAYRKYGIRVGEPYFWWYGPRPRTKGSRGVKHYSKSKPKPSQTTSSAFLKDVYSLQESIEAAKPDSVEEIISQIETCIIAIEDIKDGLEESLESIPENFRENAVGSLIQERIDNLEGWIDQLTGIVISEEDETEELWAMVVDSYPGF